MITWIRAANTFPGKIGEAIVWSKEVTAAVKRITGKDFDCLRRVQRTSRRIELDHAV